MSNFTTTILHSGYDAEGEHGAIVPPLHLSTTFKFGNDGGYDYSRSGNPTRQILESGLAQTASRPSLLDAERLLIVHAHPDDLEMANSALVEERLRRLGATGVHLLVATRGEASTINLSLVPYLVATRRQETAAACAAQGITNWQMLGLPDGKLNSDCNKRELIDKIIQYALEHQIETIITPGQAGFDGHNDHIAVHEATMLAVAALLKTYGAKVDVWASSPAPTPDAEIISVDPERKRELLLMHATQFGPFNSAVSKRTRLDEVAHKFPQYERLLEREIYVSC